MNYIVTFQEFKTSYELLEVLDRGTISLVRKGLNVVTGQYVAVKMVDTTKFPGAAVAVQREIEVLEVLQHRNCIQMQAYCYYKNIVYIIVPHAQGEVLLDWLHQKKQLTEMETAIIAHSILQGVSYLHSKNIVHRDLKLENLMFSSPGDIQSLKILDYGFSKHFESNGDTLSTVCGSPQYVAPEILNISMGATGPNMQYTQACDCWSIGVIIYMLLGGYAPFDEDDEMLMFQKIIRGEYAFDDDPWRHISQNAKTLIQGLLP